MRRIFREAADGRSALAIAKGLNRDRIPSPMGGTWDASSIRGNKARHEGILNNRLFIGEASVCKFGRRYHPETGEEAVYATEDDAVTAYCEDLRIVLQELWDTVQIELAKRTRRAAAAGNPNKARRAKHLLSGLLFCGSCGNTYIKVGKRRFGCREAIKGACTNRVTIRQQRIEALIFDQLREILLGPDLARAFQVAFEAELLQLNGAGLDEGLKTAGAGLARVRKARRAILSAIEQGADFAAYAARDAELKAEEAALEARIAELNARQAITERPPPAIPTIFAQALADLEALLGEPDTVAQTNEHLATLVRCITVIPDATAPDCLAAEIHLDLGSLRFRAGIPTMPDDVQG